MQEIKIPRPILITVDPEHRASRTRAHRQTLPTLRPRELGLIRIRRRRLQQGKQRFASSTIRLGVDEETGLPNKRSVAIPFRLFRHVLMDIQRLVLRVDVEARAEVVFVVEEAEEAQRPVAHARNYWVAPGQPS